MAKSLIVVESPTKVKTIKKYIDKNFAVKASVGHIKDLPPKRLGVDIDHGFIPEFNVIKKKQKVINEIKKAAAQAEDIYLAPDPDREGEAIAWHVAEEIRDEKKKIYRVMIHEMTGQAIKRAIAEAGELDENKFQAQKARRILDRLVGYQISPLLWKKVRRGLSAGRVQSVAMRIICEREAEIKAFVPQEYWTIDAGLKKETEEKFVARLARENGKKVELPDEAAARAAESALKGAEFVVSNVDKKEKQRHPRPPFTTSTMQQDAANRLYFSAKKTMMIAQQLYEGVDLGPEGQVGLITYMRTDSTRVAAEAADAARQYITNTLGKEYIPLKHTQYRNKKNIQDAHEAIRPTEVKHTPERVKQYLSDDQAALYELIWKRFLSSQMTAARYDHTAVDVSARHYTLRATGNVITFKGFLELYLDSTDNELAEDGQLPELAVGEKLDLLNLDVVQHFTQPPPRFSESTLVKELEERGIGRPSTYAAILSTIQEREYVDKKDRRFFPTELGLMVNDLLVLSFPDIVNVEFTANMEERLDEIEEGKATYLEILNSFYQPFKNDLEKAKKEMKNVKKAMEEPTDIKCDNCGQNMVIKWGRNGKFLACPGYPECKNTKPIIEETDGSIKAAAEKPIDEVCEKCGRAMVLKQGRYGPFLGCPGYPECKNTKPVVAAADGSIKAAKDQETDEVCEKCGKPMVIKMGRRGKFLACSGYPECKNTKNITSEKSQPQEPPPTGEGETCPECGSGMVIRKNRWGGEFMSCSTYPKCKGTKPIKAR